MREEGYSECIMIWGDRGIIMDIPVVFLFIFSEEKISRPLNTSLFFSFIIIYRFDPKLRTKRRRNIYKCHEGE